MIPKQIAKYLTVPSGRSKGGTRDVLPLRSKFFNFHAVFGKKIRLVHPLWELAPPQENRGSATGTIPYPAVSSDNSHSFEDVSKF